MAEPVIAFVNGKSERLEEVQAAVRDVGGIDLRVVEPAQLAAEMLKAIDAGARRIIVAGGDGTIGSAANVAVQHGIELGIVPAGTLNHFAKFVKLPESLADAVRVARDAPARPMDVAECNGRIFLNTSSVGAYANFVRRREKYEGKLGYHFATLVAAVVTFARLQPFVLQLEVNGVASRYVTPLVFIGVGEREMKIPAVGDRVEGGRQGLHVMVIRGRARLGYLAVAFAAASRGIWAAARTPELDSFIVSRCTIEQRHDTLALDGEIVRMPSPLEYALRSAALLVAGA
ncbi:MAG: diacylglycerol kinase catalytic region [Gemmatimonadetes bacterium]|nr:diacylglycerol kinase catalytic region [Gemmatimonadota bacterium]